MLFCLFYLLQLEYRKESPSHVMEQSFTRKKENPLALLISAKGSRKIRGFMADPAMQDQCPVDFRNSLRAL